MTTIRLLAIAAAVSMVASGPALARSHHHRHHHRHHAAATGIYLHNYGPAVSPDRPFAYYDGSSHVRCKQSAASYLGQNGRRHPCN